MARITKSERREREERASRLRQARAEAGFRSSAAAAKRFGWNENTYKAHERNQNGFGLADARKYALAFGKQLGWLNFAIGDDELRVVPIGEEFPPDPSPDERPSLGSETGARGMPPQSVALLDVTAGMGGGGLTVIFDGVPGKRGMTFAAEHVRDYWRLPTEILSSLGARPGDVVFIPVQGDSMGETLREGDYVLVDTRHRLPSPDGIYALGDDFGGIVVKRIELTGVGEERRIRIISDNPKHVPKERGLEEVNIIGRVLRRFGPV